MDEQAIRILDDAQLTQEAFRLGLVPTEVFPLTSPFHVSMFARHQCLAGHEVVVPWVPATDVNDAQECLRRLRPQKFYTAHTWEDDGLIQVFSVNKLTGDILVWQEAFTTPHQEARAMVLCAVLAMTWLASYFDTLTQPVVSTQSEESL